jgi:hypothetical protein
MKSPACAATKPLIGKSVREQVGVNIHFTDALPGEMDMLGGIGFGFIRMDLYWAATERQPGVYDFSHYDHLLTDMQKHKMRGLWILGYGNPIYGVEDHPRTDEQRAEFARWAAAAVTHFKGHHILWEMWNEPDYTWPHPSWTDDYIKLALATGKSIRQAEPDEIYVGPAEGSSAKYPPTINPKFLEACFKGGTLKYWKAVTVHPYRNTAPETVTPEYKNLRALIAKYEPAGADIPLLAGEWGYCVMPTGGEYFYTTTDALQAAYFDREVLTNLKDVIPLSIWYDWRNDGDDPANNEANFGLVRHPNHAGRVPVFDPKPPYYAAKAFLAILGDCQFSRTIPVTGETDALLFSFVSQKTHRYAAYTTASHPESVTLPLPAATYSIVDISGNLERVVNSSHSGLPLTLTGDTQFIIRTR